jgi:iron only hydrogenase large subunit-like protein/uncharacterized Fe-S cluster-containing protein
MLNQPQVRPPTQVVYTNKARCRDCYLCLRRCLVKAIGMRDGQAFVDGERCLACGTCIRNCPQKAKNYRNDLQRAIKLLESPGPAAVSIAPSFVALFGPWQQKRLPSALRKLGFTYVAETAVGAYYTAKSSVEAARAHPDRSHIVSSCPAVVSYIERYFPQLVGALIPVVSPMIAHGRMLKERLGGKAVVIFIGPCVAKKTEAQREEYKEVIDCVLTFEELLTWFENAGINLDEMEESGFDERPEGEARFFPLAGGAAKTGGLTSDLLDSNTLAVTGGEEVTSAFIGLDEKEDPLIIEPLFCQGGCVNGPALGREMAPHQARGLVIKYAGQEEMAVITAPSKPLEKAALTTRFSPRSPGPDAFSEQQIQEQLARTGKSRLEDQLNCGACGYPTCREKVRAVLLGLAEPEMCIPHMRRLAEQRTDRIIETSPNGIIILDEHLTILHMNPAFQKFFNSTPGTLGKRISHLMDPAPFERVALRGEKIDVNVRHEKFNLFCRQIIYPLKAERQIVGIFVSLTANVASQEKLDHLKQQTVTKARELLEGQVEMARRIVEFLGESTARSEDLVDELMLQTQELNGQEQQPKGKSRPWDTSTLK